MYYMYYIIFRNVFYHVLVDPGLCGAFRQSLTVARALPSKFDCRSGPRAPPSNSGPPLALRERPSKFTGRPGPYYPPLTPVWGWSTLVC